MGKRIRGGTRRPEIEVLEDRAVPAGNVTATLLDRGTLRVTGDTANNSIAVLAEAGSANITVQGWGADTTTVNGQGQATFVGVTEIQLDLQEGNDRVWVDALVDGGIDRLDIKTGDGNDSVTLWYGYFRSVAVDTGKGDDFLGHRYVGGDKLTAKLGGETMCSASTGPMEGFDPGRWTEGAGGIFTTSRSSDTPTPMG
jgi:hypothetical protein